MRWHDPFNRTLKYEMARSVQQVQAEKKGVEKSKKVSKQKQAAIDAQASAHTAALQHWFKNVRGRGAHAGNDSHSA